MSPARRANRLQVRIGELRVPAVARSDAKRIGAAATQELTRLLERAELANSLLHSRSVTGIRAGNLRTDLRGRPENIGRELAQLIARALIDAKGGTS